MDVHHVPPQHVGKQLIPGYDSETAPSIVIPKDVHRDIRHPRGAYQGTAKEAVEQSLQQLRDKGVPWEAIEQLREMIRKKYGI